MAQTFKDPVCGMDVDETVARHTAQHNGQTYYFCHPSCLERFESAPDEFVAGDGALGTGDTGSRGAPAQVGPTANWATTHSGEFIDQMWLM